MKMIIENNEIFKTATILAENSFINVKNKKNLIKLLYIYINNYFILSLKKGFECKIVYNPKDNENKYSNFFYLFINNFNYLYIDENIELKNENIEIEIIKGGDNE